MKIIIVGPVYPYRGGLAAFNERLAKEFATQGHEVEMFTFCLQYPSFLFPGKTQYSDGQSPRELSIKREINSVNPLNWISVARKIRKKKPDRVVFTYWMSFVAPCFGTIARIVKKEKAIQCIGLVHNMIPHEPNIMDKLFPAYFVHSMDAFVALSRSVRDDISKYDKKNKPKCFSPHPIYDHYGEMISRETALAELNLDKTNKYLLFFGIIRDYKGLDLLLKAYSDSRFRTMNLKLIVAGEFYNNASQYFALAETLGLKNEIIWHPHFIPDNRVKYYFCAADIVVQPYKTATQSGVTQIAYYYEKPMLVTNVGGLGEIVPDQKVGYVVEPDEKAIADALVDFFTYRNEQSYADNLKIEKEKFSWKRMTEALTNFAK